MEYFGTVDQYVFVGMSNEVSYERFYLIIETKRYLTKLYWIDFGFLVSLYHKHVLK